jgi:hypothetical protein
MTALKLSSSLPKQPCMTLARFPPTVISKVPIANLVADRHSPKRSRARSPLTRSTQDNPSRPLSHCLSTTSSALLRRSAP